MSEKYKEYIVTFKLIGYCTRTIVATDDDELYDKIDSCGAELDVDDIEDLDEWDVYRID